jgi:splicing factor 3B subunit 3
MMPSGQWLGDIHSYTPRRFVKHPEQPLFYVIESDNNVLSPATRQRLIDDSQAQNGEATDLPPADFGYPRATGQADGHILGGSHNQESFIILTRERYRGKADCCLVIFKITGHWASCIQVVEPITTKSVIFNLDLEDNEAAVSSPF